MKPRYKRKIWWGVAISVSALALLAVFLPSFITLNYMRPRITDAIFTQTGIRTEIRGDIHFSWLGGIQYVAKDVVVPGGVISSVYFPRDLSAITISGAHLNVSNLVPPKFSGTISVQNSVITFQNKDYTIIDGELENGLLRGTVRTNQHRYKFDSDGDVFHITNAQQSLSIVGNLYSDGSAHGTLSIDTDNANRFFDFIVPNIRGRIELTMDFDWDGTDAFRFANIRGIYNNDTLFTGDIELPSIGIQNIRIAAIDADIDLSFLLDPKNFFEKFTGEFTGKIKLGKYVFSSVVITSTSNGTMRADVKNDSMRASCKINAGGFVCDDFRRGDLYGTVSKIGPNVIMDIKSPGLMPDKMNLNWSGRFEFSDAAGTVENNQIKFEYVRGKTIQDIGIGIEFLPGDMMDTPGDFEWTDDMIVFTPTSGEWYLQLNKNSFLLHGNNIKDMFPNIDLQSVVDMEYMVSGAYHKNIISNLEIKIANHLFTGTAIGNNVTLHSSLLNIDAFTNQNWINNYQQLKFLTAAPITIPYRVPINISLTADTIIYNGDAFANFVYSKRGDSQTFSITDDARGSILVDMTKTGGEYGIRVRLDRFKTSGSMLAARMPINIRDTLVTAALELSTYGRIDVDFWDNMFGAIDMTLNGGKILGLGIDELFANAKSITTLNAEYMLSAALDGGQSDLEKLHISGKYHGGNFETVTPFEMSLRHTDVYGIMRIENGKIEAKLEMILRGTSPEPTPLSLSISDTVRNYSLSQIMINFDPDYMREFVKTHNKF